MKIRFQKSFTKKFTKLTDAQKQHVKDTLEIFNEHPFNDSLRNHPLKETWAGYRSITADEDLRIHYKELSGDTVLLVTVGSHDELYK